MKAGAERRIRIKAEWLYRSMPGAAPVPENDSGLPMWGEVDATEHFAFCERIARLIESVDCRTHVEPD